VPVSPRRRLATACTAAVLVLLGGATAAQAAPPLPQSMAALGDSITQAYDVSGSYGNHPANSWSTGTASTDGISSHAERLAAAGAPFSGRIYNDSVTGAKVADTLAQAQSAVAQGAQYVTVLVGANDVCTSSASTMTPVATFQSQFASTMATLSAGLPAGAHVFVSSIPNVYGLWSVLRSNFIAQLVWKSAGICQSMLSTSNTEATRQAVLAREQAFNTALATVCTQYANCRWDGLATYNYNFSSSQVSKLDYFHPSLTGQAALAGVTWTASWWAA
jgi:lysophospholipase L1-like esterase